FIRVCLRVLEGDVSVIAVDATATGVIDEIRIGAADTPATIELVCTPLGRCQTIVFRNGPEQTERGRVIIESVECVDLGPAESGDPLTAPDALRLRPVGRWTRYYGTPDFPSTERHRAARYAKLKRVKRMPWIEQLQVYVYPNDDLSRALYISGLYEPL